MAVTPNFWSADGATFDNKTFSDLVTHHDTVNGSYGLWIKEMDDLEFQVVQYALDKQFTEAEVLHNENYFGGTSGALRDGAGDLITDGDGFVIFTT